MMNVILAVVMGSTWLAASLYCQHSCEKKGAQSSATGTARQESPFACQRMALSPRERKKHFEVLGPKLHSLVKSIRELADGYEFEFPPDNPTIQLIADWTAGERLCCPFFGMDTRLEKGNGALWLRLTGRDGVKQFIRADFARWFQQSL